MPAPATVGGSTSTTVGNGNDEVAHAPSGKLIGSSIGSFQVSGLTSETDSMLGGNAYGLQVNSQFPFTTSTTYTDGRSAAGWEQFVYVTDPGGQYVTGTYIQYWLISYYSTYGVCPSTAPPGGGFNGVPWANFEGSCVSNSPLTFAPSEPATSLASLTLEGYANFGNSNDEVMFCVSGGGCYSVSITEHVLNLYLNWQYSEFNVFGYGDASQANFNIGTTITVTNTLKDQSRNVIVPSCVNTGYTGETNNLNLGSCSSNSNGQIVFTESNGSTTTTTTAISTSTVGQVCYTTTSTMTTNTIVLATVTSSTTSTTTVCTQSLTSTVTSTTLTTFTRPTTTISLLLTPSTIGPGSQVTVSGSIFQNPGTVQVTVSISKDSGSTWTTLMLLMTDNSGNYSTSWTPPYPGNFLLEAGWSGNNQLAGSTSSPASLTVNGTAPLIPTLLLFLPSTGTPGQVVDMTITVFNPTNSLLTASVTIEVIGPSNYVVFNVIQVNVFASSQSTGYWDWTLPNNPGTYIVTVGLYPPAPGAYDTATIQVL